MIKKLPLLLLLLLSGWASAQKLDMAQFEEIKPRNIGPAGMSGRVTAIEAELDNPDVIYVGTASGGLWKSTGGGIVWEPIFDKEKAAGIGSIAISPSNPDVVWVGTGEGNPRNSQSAGYGVYRTNDGGRSWEYKGLGSTRNIHRMLVDPNNPDVAYAGAIGNAWADSEDRGVYKTTDGGKTWNKVLYVNKRTGVADMVMDPSNPNKIIAAMWEYRRWPWSFKSGGEGSGLYVTYDGGANWKRLGEEEGMPAGEMGRMGLAISQSNPDVVYALIESKKTAFYKSTDGAKTFKKVQDKMVGDRPFYYADVAVDPENENRVYNVFSNVHVSNDGAKTFEVLLGWDRVHGDHHFWYIHPKDGSFIINGNDGGMAISRDRGETWRMVTNLPVGQFYHISVDNDIPFNVLGGMQDNGSWKGPSHIWRYGGIRNEYWDEVAFGDGFDVSPDPDNTRYGFGMWQGGNVMRIDFETGASRWVKPSHPDGIPLRYNWNAAISRDPRNPDVIYFGSQFVHRSTDRGESWTIISPDLTTNDPEKQKQLESGGLTYDVTGAENHTTILAISPSPRNSDELWVGTDDGNIQLSRDAGKNWTNLSPKIKGLPKNAWVPQIRPSAHRDGEAFVVVNNYRQGDWTPYLYRTSDYGKSWENMLAPDEVWGYVLSFVQDPVEPKLMFLGTEFGLYVSIDAGATWTQWTNGYPTASTMDLVIHPRDHDLAIGTFGRSLWILDDIRPLRALASKGSSLLSESLHAFPAPDAYLAHYQQAAGTRFHADAIFRGENRPYGALLSYWLKDIKQPEEKKPGMPELEKDTVTVTVHDASGAQVRMFKTVASAGMNRFNWDLNGDGFRAPGSPKPKDGTPLPAGLPVLPGTYTVKLSYKDMESSTTVKVLPDPRVDAPMADKEALTQLGQQFSANVRLITTGVDNLKAAKKDIGEAQALIAKRLEDEEAKKEWAERSKALTAKADSLMQLVIPDEKIAGIYRDPALLSSKIFAVAVYFNSAFGGANPPFFGPSKAQEYAMADLEKDMQAAISAMNDFVETEYRPFQQDFKALDLSIFEDWEPLEIKD